MRKIPAVLVALLAIAAAPARASTTITVTNGSDSGAGSLRAAIAAASAGDTIVVPSGTTVSLSSGELLLGKNITITGGGARTTVVNANGTGRVFDIQNATVSISGLTITGGNSTVQNVNGIDGGGIQVDGNPGGLHLSDSTVTGNSAPGRFGSGIEGSGVTITVTGSTIARNTGADSGGGIDWSAANTGALTVTDTTIVNNSVTSGGRGGGLDINDVSQPVSLVNDTIAGNDTGHGDGGGIGFENAQAGVITMANTIVAGNGGDPGAQNCLFGNHDTSLGHNLESVSPDQCGFTAAGDLVGVDPGLGALRDNGGQTDTEALPQASKAVQAASNSFCPATDQRGIARPQLTTCDIGAYEWAQADLGVLQTGAPTALPLGQTATFSLTVTNAGPNPEFAATLTDTLSTGLSLVSATASQGSCAGTPLSCSLGQLNAGQSATITIVARSTAAGTATSTAAITGTNGDLNTANNQAQSSVSVSSAAPPAKPALTALTLKPTTFAAATSGASIAAAGKTGTTVSYRDSQAATTTFTVLAALPGVKHGVSCVKRPKHLRKHARRCTRYLTVGSFTHTDTAGSNQFHFTGRVHGHRLARGTYRLKAVARSGNRQGNTLTTRFRVR
jgi:uncharacterized repeat protein (TIGR01451 family)